MPITSDGFCKLGGDAVEGTYAATDFWTGNPDPKVRSFIKKFHEIYPKDKLPHTTTAAMYDTLYITRDIVAKMGLSGEPGDLQKDREKIRDGWANLKDYTGLSKTTIDENGEAVKDYYTLVVEDGKWIRLNK